ncbi:MULTISPECIES: DUF6318 family protein [unclassified Yimella]|uniref:DUF6318 family protein n=1 Tax=unclassified Yimella TaxID=2649892 RepID=UPI001459FC7E|nr:MULTISPECIES: DUF6318 family protein [unclassified Yimella]MCG8655846.1 hypothetical protein [Yimella sp. NH-Cas1]
MQGLFLLLEVLMTARFMRTVAPLVAASAACGLLVGCGGGSPEAESSPPSSTTTSAASPTTSKTTSTSATPTSQTSNATYAGAPGVPEAAKHKTDAGAIAFATYYNDLINDLGLKPMKAVLDPLANDTCKTCRGHEETIDSNVAKKNRFDGTQFILKRAYKRSDGTIGLVVDLPAVNIVDSSGAIAQEFPKEPRQSRVFHLGWSKSGWRVNEIQYDLTVTS